MEITSFILGMLSVVAVIVIAVIVKGMVKIVKLEKELKATQENIEWKDKNCSDSNRDIYDSLSRMGEHIYHRVDEVERNLTSYVDSRIDKLQSKKEAIK
jgi:cell division protein FtsL